MGFEDLANSLLQPIWDVLRVNPSRGRVLFYLVLPVGASSGGSMEMLDMETWLQWLTAFSSLGACFG